jgi:hypothetical protein
MNLYLNGKEYKVTLQKILSQNLYNKVTPLLSELENSEGARKAYENILQKRIIGDEYFSGKINLLQGANAWDALKDDFKLQELIAEVMIMVRENIFEYLSLNDSTIKIIFRMFQTCIDKKLIVMPEILEAIDSDVESEFWQEQDLNSILEELKFFRQNVLARIKTNT